MFIVFGLIVHSFKPNVYYIQSWIIRNGKRSADVQSQKKKK